MCTLALAFQVFPNVPIVVAANRDELLDRPSTPPERRDTSPVIVSPRDEEAGGTWIGYNEAGLFAAITNRWTDTDLAGERSRGLLMMDVLQQPNVDAAASTIEGAVARDEYDGFYLVVADAASGVIFEWDGEFQITALDPGLHVVMNTGFDDRFRLPDHRREAAERQAESARLVRERLAPGVEETVSDWMDRAGEVLGDHEVGVCVHGNGYGTRSSSLIAIPVDGEAVYRFADGPPCRTSYESINEQF